MDIETLRYFQYIAKYKNITKAASHFYISQSTLSRQIMNLEKELGVTLFIRDNRKLELTEAGNVFSKECDLLIKHMETAIYNTQITGKGHSGSLSIVAPGNISPLLSKAIHIFKERYPGVKIVVEAYDFSEILTAVLYDTYDVAFTYSINMAEYEDLRSIEFGEESFSIVIASDLVQDLSLNSVLQVIKSTPLILPSYEKPPFIDLIINGLQHSLGTNLVPTYVNTTESAMLQISLGLAYSIMPTYLTSTKSCNSQTAFLPLGQYFPELKLTTTSKILMLYKESNPSLQVSNFVKIIQDMIIS